MKMTLSWLRHSQGDMARKQYDFVFARTYYAQCLSLSQELGQKRTISLVLEGFADIAAARLNGAPISAELSRAADELGRLVAALPPVH